VKEVKGSVCGQIKNFYHQDYCLVSNNPSVSDKTETSIKTDIQNSLIAKAW